MEKGKRNCKIHALPVLKDNIIWIWEIEKEAVVVDPAIAEPVEKYLKTNNLTLNSILQTHHHDDHIGGTKVLLKHWPSASVIACKSDVRRIPFQTCSVIDNEELIIMGHRTKVFEVPGHTKNHIVFYIPKTNKNESKPILFCGDTLFGGGCGRLFEGTEEEMFKSLNRLKLLPKNTQVYCAHEYTEANLKWANHLYPEDLLIKNRLAYVSKIRVSGETTLPSSIGEEQKTNLFFRAKSIKEFSRLRTHKDNWIG